jgi:hypothetical protein
MADTPKATLKKSIKPVSFTIQVTARKVNENGTFSQLEITGITSPTRNSTLRAVAPPQAGGAIYLKCDTLEGLELLQEQQPDGLSMSKVKLF